MLCAQGFLAVDYSEAKWIRQVNITITHAQHKCFGACVSEKNIVIL